MMLIPKLLLDLSREIRLGFRYIQYYIYSTYLREKRAKNRLHKEILLVRHSRGGFTLKLNNCVYSMHFLAFVLNINYIFTPVNSYI